MFFYKKVVAALAVLALTSCAEKSAFEDQQDVGSFVADSAMIENFKAEAGDRVFFAYDNSSLDDVAISVLEKQIAWLKAKNVKNITIEGHCDDRGTREYNLGLGERRARAVASYVQSQCSDININVVSYGKDKPVMTEASDIEEVRKQNRVCVIVLE